MGEKAEDPVSKDRATTRNFLVSIPYIPGVSEQFQRVCRSHRVPSYHKPFNKSLLVSPKDKTWKVKQCRLVYRVKCGGCEKYIAETARTLRVRFKENTDSKVPNSALTKHTSIIGHKYTLADVKVLVKEDRDFKRKVKEAVANNKNKPALNSDRGHIRSPPSFCNLCDVSL